QVTEKELNLINTHKPGVTQVEGKKIWEDNNNQDGLRPTSIKVKLIAKVKGKEISELSKTQEFKPINVQDNIWHYSFGELPTHYQGSKVKYSVQEIDVPQGYQVTEKGLDLINTHQVEKTEIKGQKTWEDDNNQDGLRPTSIKVKLIAKVKGKEISELSKTQEFKPIKVQNNIWHYSFGELPTHYQGSKVKYSVKEIDVPQGYQVTEKELNLINTHQVEKTEIKGQKTWEDNNNQDGLRPESITIRLYDGDGEVKHITVTAKDKWKYSFTNLPVNKNGKKIDYTISEDKVKDYTTSIEGFNVTNTHKPGITQVEGKKIWEDDNNRDGLRPTSIKVKLIAKVKGKEI
ncbi:Cna B-type domain-containing protein, partial [Ligilactobacillus ceti]